MRTFAGLSVSILASAIGAQPPDSHPKPPGPASELKPAPAVREFPAKDSQRNPVKVSDVIKGWGLDEAKMWYCDEPPGKLQWLRWSKVKPPGTAAEVDIEIAIVYTLDVFSITREWDIKAVRAATVRKVTISPPRTFD